MKFGGRRSGGGDLQTRLEFAWSSGLSCINESRLSGAWDESSVSLSQAVQRFHRSENCRCGVIRVQNIPSIFDVSSVCGFELPSLTFPLHCGNSRLQSLRLAETEFSWAAQDVCDILPCNQHGNISHSCYEVS